MAVLGGWEMFALKLKGWKEWWVTFEMGDWRNPVLKVQTEGSKLSGCRKDILYLHIMEMYPLLAITCSMSTTERLCQDVKYVHS